MSITFACGYCGKTFTVDDKFAGKRGKCKACGAVMEIPASGPAPKFAGSSANREISPSRKAPIARDEEISPSRRPPAPAPASSRNSPPDLFGLDDSPRRPRASAMKLDDEDFEPAPLPGRMPRPATSGSSEPVKKKKKKKAPGSTFPFKLVAGIFAGVVAFAVMFVVVGNAFQSAMRAAIPGWHTKEQFEALFKERLTLNRQLLDLLRKTDDVPSAEANSAEANRLILAIANNLGRLGKAKTLKTDADALSRKYEGPLLQVTNEVIQVIQGFTQKPEVLLALNVKAAFEELDRQERAFPSSMQQANAPMPNQVPRAAFNPPPQAQPAMPGPNANRQRGMPNGRQQGMPLQGNRGPGAWNNNRMPGQQVSP